MQEISYFEAKLRMVRHLKFLLRHWPSSLAENLIFNDAKCDYKQYFYKKEYIMITLKEVFCRLSYETQIGEIE